MGEIERLAELQRAENQRRAAMTPKERAADSLEQLRYIASVEEDHWLRDHFGLDDPAPMSVREAEERRDRT